MKSYKQRIYGLMAVLAMIFVGGISIANAQVATGFTFNNNLTIGSTGADVIQLQSYLEGKGFLMMPFGVAKGYFGSITQSAVARYQAANGIMPTAGYFGPLTRAYINARIGTDGPVVNPPSDNNNNNLSGGDGDFKDFDVLGNPDNEDLEENSDTDVLAFEFEADDSDLRVERVDVLFTETTNDTRPWRVFDEVTLLGDDDELVTVDASDEDNWDEVEDDEYRIRFDDVDEIVREGDTERFTINVTSQDNIDDDEMEEWTVWLDEDGVRAMNAEGIDIYEGDSDDLAGATDERTFTLEEAEEGDLTISVDSNDEGNEDEQIEVNEDDETDDVVLYTAQVESKQDGNNIEEVTVTIESLDSTNLSAMINTLYLYIDGDEVGSESVDGTSDSVTFDDIDIDIDEDEEVEFQVRADIESTDDGDNYTDGAGVKVTGISIDFVDANDDDVTVSDTTDGGEITFSVDALMIDLVNTPLAESPVASDESKGRFFVEFKVTAPDEEDIYIPKGATTSTATSSGAGAEFVVVDGNGNTVAATTNSSSNLLVKVSGGSETGDYYRISNGNTVTLRLDVIVDNTGASSPRTLGIQLTGLNYKVGSVVATTQQYSAGIDEDYRSDTAYLLTSNTSN